MEMSSTKWRSFCSGLSLSKCVKSIRLTLFWCVCLNILFVLCMRNFNSICAVSSLNDFRISLKYSACVPAGFGPPPLHPIVSYGNAVPRVRPATYINTISLMCTWGSNWSRRNNKQETIGTSFMFLSSIYLYRIRRNISQNVAHFLSVISGHVKTVSSSERSRYNFNVFSNWLRPFSNDLE